MIISVVVVISRFCNRPLPASFFDDGHGGDVLHREELTFQNANDCKLLDTELKTPLAMSLFRT